MKKVIHKLGFWILAAGFLTALNGCDISAPVRSVDSESPAKTISSNVGEIPLLKVDRSKLSGATLSKSSSANNINVVEAFIKAGKGEKLEVGEGQTGKSKVDIKKHDLPADMTVIFNWADEVTYSGSIDAVETPGVVLNNPVKIELTYKWADLIDIDEDHLGLYFYNPDTDAWEAVAGDLNQGAKRITAEITRFGQYAIYEMKDGVLKDVFKRGVNTYYVSKFIKNKSGGKVEVGGKDAGKCKIEFKKYDLSEDMTIEFQWAADGYLEGLLSNVEFGPHGTEFNNPVKVEFSYQLADLGDIDEDDLQVFYYNEDTGEWELIGGEVDKKKKIIKVMLKHFSRYAISKA